MRRCSTTVASLAGALVLLAPAIAAAKVRVSAEPATISTTLGRDFGLRTTITNTGKAPTASVLAHLNVLSLRADVYLDPEDWSAERTRYLGAIPAGASTTVEWKLKAVNPGSVAAFVSVLPQAGSTEAPTNGPTVAIAVAQRRTLNSDGILALAFGIPALIAALGVGVQRRRNHRSAETSRDATRMQVSMMSTESGGTRGAPTARMARRWDFSIGTRRSLRGDDRTRTGE